MEEVDNIVISTLKEIGCYIDDDVVGLASFTSNILVESCVRCLRIIQPNYEGSHVMPEVMSARYRMCTDLANSIKNLGYPGEIGYQTFLYSSTKEWRKLMMFLLEKLPKEKSASVNEPLGAAALLSRAVAAELKREMKLSWTPSFCKMNAIRWTSKDSWHLEGKRSVDQFRSIKLSVPEGSDDVSRKVPKAVKRYQQVYLPFVCDQPPVKRDVIASLIEQNAEDYVAQQEWELEWNRAGLASRLSEEDYKARKKQLLKKKVASQLRSAKAQGQSTGLVSTSVDFNQLVNSFASEGFGGGRSTRFQKSERLQFTSDQGPVVEAPQTQEDVRKKREQEVVSLQERLAEVTAQLESMEMDIKKYLVNQQQLAEATASQEAKNKDLEEEFRIKKKTMELLPEADENIVKLEALVDSSSERLVKLAKKWEEHREPLIEEYRQLKEAHTAQLEASGGLLDQIKSLREKMKQLAEEAKMKDELYRRLVGEHERMTKDQSRSSYTKRIMELVGNIQKQKDGIASILADTQQVQREINQLLGKLERVFIVTDEQIYKDARSDPARRTAYKNLAALRDNYSMVLDAIREIWQVRRQIKDLKDQIDNESSKKVGANLEKLSRDLQEMKDENKQLISKLKALR